MSKKISKKDRHEQLQELLKNDPFLTDEELSEEFSVSIQTVRLDRLKLGIPELRERVKSVATKQYEKVKSINQSEIVGELIDLEIGKRGISILETNKEMVFEKSKIVKGHYIFAMAESLSLAVINEEVALTGVANVKYNIPVLAGQKLIAKAEVTNNKNDGYYVHVMISVKNEQVFRSKFLMKGIR